MRINPVKTEIFHPGEDLARFIARYIKGLSNGSILAVSSKMVALAEGRTAPLQKREQLIRKESRRAIKTKHTWLTEKDGLLMASAGIDESNANGKIVLLPKDSFASARKLRSSLLQNYKIKKLGVVITDSRIFPLRAGVTGAALGYAGFKGLRDYRGQRDVFGRKLTMTQTNVADSLATAAALVMGEGKERQPLAVIEGAPVEFTDRAPRRSEMAIRQSEDMFEPLLRRFKGS